MDIFKDRVKKSGDLLALSITRNGITRNWTYSEYYKDCCIFASALIELKITERSAINVIGFNSTEWIIGFMGAIFANLISSGVYTTNSPGACVYVANHSDAEIILVENMKQYVKYHSDKTPIKVKYYIFYGEPVPEELQGKNVLHWNDIMTIGKLTYEKNKEELENRIKKQTPGTTCVYIYTSGTTSMPKACMLSHDAIIVSPYTQIDTYLKRYKSISGRDRVVSFLPLCHVAAFSMDVLVNLIEESILYFAQPDAMQGSLVKTFQDVRPTLVLAVPRVYEKIHERVLSVLSKKGAFTQKLSNWAFSVGKEATINQLAKQPNPFGFTVAHMMVLNKIKKQMGLDQVQLAMVGGAPTQKITFDFFASLNIKLLGLYGLSETAGPITYALPNWTKLYSAGYPIYGISIKVHKPDEKGEGEICARGRCVFAGYLKDAEKTKAVFDEDGYYHTGDLGYIDSDGFVFITGRIKELLKTSGGEYVAPLLIESKFLEMCPIASNIVIIGDARKYLTAIITLRGQVGKDGKIGLNINSDALEIIEKLGSNSKTIPEASQDVKVNKYIWECIEKVNKFSISNVQRIQKFTILPREFSLDENEITPTMKLRRSAIYKKHANIIEAMYKSTTL